MKDNKKDMLFLLIPILLGIILLFFGVKITYEKSQETKGYVSTEGEFIGSSVYPSDEDGTTHGLKYLYKVDGVEYTISTDYGTGIAPKLGTKKTIEYNPSNPDEAVISGMGINGLLFILGFMFTAIPSIPIFLMLLNAKNETMPRIKDVLFGCFFGLVFTIMGGGCYYAMCAGSDSLSLIYAFETNGLLISIPIIFIIVGIYIIIGSLLGGLSLGRDINKNKICSPDEVVNETDNELYLKNEFIEQKQDNVLNNLNRISEVGAAILQMVGSSMFTIVCTWIFVKGADTFTKIAITPFLICGIAILFQSIVSIVWAFISFKSRDKMEKFDILLSKIQTITSRIYIIGFLIFWFGFLIIFDYNLIKEINENGLPLLLFSLIFWAVGIFIAYKNFKR